MSYINYQRSGSTPPPPSGGGVVITYLDTPGSGTHELNANTQMVEVYLFGGGQGGGGGQANYSFGSDGNGGAAGLPGSVVHRMIPVDFFGGAGASVSYTIGTGGAGALGVIAFTPSPLGAVGGDTEFGYLVAPGGGSALQASLQNTDNVNSMNPSVVESISIIPARSSAGASVTTNPSSVSLDGGSVYAGNTTILYQGGAGNPAIATGPGNPVVVGASGNVGQDGFDAYFSCGAGASGGGAGNSAKGGNGANGSWPAGGGSGGGATSVEDFLTTGGDGGDGADGYIIVIEWLG